jgi:hypothetical protein
VRDRAALKIPRIAVNFVEAPCTGGKPDDDWWFRFVLPQDSAHNDGGRASVGTGVLCNLTRHVVLGGTSRCAAAEERTDRH